MADSILRLTQFPRAEYDLRLSRVQAAGFKLRLNRVPVTGYKLRLTPSYSWLEFWRLDTSCGCLKFRRLDTTYGWLHPTADSTSGNWIRVAVDSILQLILVPAAGYELWLILSCGWIEFRQLDTRCSWLCPMADSYSGGSRRLTGDLSCGWLRVLTNSILRLNQVPATGLEMQLTYTLILQYIK